MPRRRSNKPPTVSGHDVRTLFAKTDRILTEWTETQEVAREGLADHFQQAAEILPIPEDQARRERMARKQR